MLILILLMATHISFRCALFAVCVFLVFLDFGFGFWMAEATKERGRDEQTTPNFKVEDKDGAMSQIGPNVTN